MVEEHVVILSSYVLLLLACLAPLVLKIYVLLAVPCSWIVQHADLLTHCYRTTVLPRRCTFLTRTSASTSCFLWRCFTEEVRISVSFRASTSKSSLSPPRKSSPWKTLTVSEERFCLVESKGVLTVLCAVMFWSEDACVTVYLHIFAVSSQLYMLSHSIIMCLLQISSQVVRGSFCLHLSKLPLRHCKLAIVHIFNFIFELWGLMQEAVVKSSYQLNTRWLQFHTAVIAKQSSPFILFPLVLFCVLRLWVSVFPYFVITISPKPWVSCDIVVGWLALYVHEQTVR